MITKISLKNIYITMSLVYFIEKNMFVYRIGRNIVIEDPDQTDEDVSSTVDCIGKVIYVDNNIAMVNFSGKIAIPVYLKDLYVMYD